MATNVPRALPLEALFERSDDLHKAVAERLVQGGSLAGVQARPVKCGHGTECRKRRPRNIAPANRLSTAIPTKGSQ